MRWGMVVRAVAWLPFAVCFVQSWHNNVVQLSLLDGRCCMKTLRGPRQYTVPREVDARRTWSYAMLFAGVGWSKILEGSIQRLCGEQVRIPCVLVEKLHINCQSH